MKTRLTNDQRLELEAAHRYARDKRSAYRINTILLWDDGFSFAEIAAILRLDDATLRRHLEQYQNGGPKELLETNFSGGTSKLSALQQNELSIFLDQNLCLSTLEVIDHVETAYGVKYAASGMAKLLGVLGFVYKKPIRVPCRFDASLQQEFIEEYFQFKASKGENDKIYFVDGVHPIHNAMPAYGWIKKGSEKPLKTNAGRARLNINGALDPDSLEIIARADDTLATNSSLALLKEIEARNPKSHKIWIILDNARYYYNAEVLGYIKNSRQLVARFLPPYSPNLNLIERVWRFFKKKVLYNRFYPNFQDFKNACGNFFATFPAHYDELSSLISDDFQSIIAA